MRGEKYISALHYIEDFDGVLKNINNLLVKDGYFIFSQESPLSTCFSGGERWTRDENGNKLHLNLTNYGREKEASSEWFVEDVTPGSQGLLLQNDLLCYRLSLFSHQPLPP